MDESNFQKAVDDTIDQGVHQLELDDFEREQDEELGIESSEGTISRDDYITAYDEFVRNPSMDGVDSKFKLTLLFKAVQNEIESGELQLKQCGACDSPIGSENFAEEFVSAYQSHVLNTKTKMTKNTAKTIYNALRKNWGAVIITIVDKLVPLVDRYLSTKPRKLNSVEDFPYTIKDNQIYHDRCIEQEN